MDGIATTMTTGGVAIADVAIKVTAGLRRSMARSGIRQIPDFVNGLVFGGLLLQKNYPGEGEETFVDVFERTAHGYYDAFQEKRFETDLAQIRHHDMGVTDQSKTDMLITAGLSAERTIATIAGEYGLDRGQTLEMTAAALASVLAADPGMTRESLEVLIGNMRERTATWDEMIPSDAEMGFDEADDE